MIRYAAFVCLLALQFSSLVADESALQQRQQRLENALDRVQPAVVGVTDGIGFGSGVVVSADGIVLTASHVVESSSHFRRRPRRTYVIFPDGSEYDVEVLGMNRSADAAMLRIMRKPADGRDFPHVDLGRSAKVRTGDYCFALGHPGGFRKSRPAPVRFGRVLSVGDMTIISDNAIVLGDSGGPLFDLDGQLIGIHSMITEVIVENRHVAIDVWHRDWDRLKEGDAWGQLRAYDTELAESDFFGADLRWRHFVPEVRRVTSDGPADQAGIQPGDTLLSVAGQRFADRLELSTLLETLHSNEETDVVLLRSDEQRTVRLTTGVRPDPGAPSPDYGDDDQDHREAERDLTLNRRIGPYEKRSADSLNDFRAAARNARNSVVELREFGRTLALGTVVSEDGYILTKASELHRAVEPECVFPDGTRRKIRRVAEDEAFDLALLKTETRQLDPIRWSNDPVRPGRMVVTTDSRGNPLLPGVISVGVHELETSSKAFLGVVPESHNSGVRLAQVIAGGAADRSGLKAGDIVLKINDSEMSGPDHLVRHLQIYSPGDEIAVRIIRENRIQTIQVRLTARFVSEQQDALLPRYRDTKQLGKYASLHNSGFPEVLQHDTDLFPQQCGGPLLDLNGEAVGLNIARSSRITSYAIPAAAVKQVLEKLKKQDTEAAL